jgi:hypothetical protein
MVSIKDGNELTGTHWDWDEEKLGPPILQVDFHHTISRRCGSCPGERSGELCAGQPQYGAKEILSRLHKRYKIVVKSGYGGFANNSRGAAKEIEDYLVGWDIPFDSVQTDKIPAAFIVDDRNVVHNGSWYRVYNDIVTREGPENQAWRARARRLT